jgi:CheY-like chemotaxis protein
MADIAQNIPSPPSDELIFAEETEAAYRPRPSWKLLVVNDEEEVQVITRMVLEGMTFSGRGLTFLGAYSAREAREILRRESDIAVILLAVVMESGQAGLELVEFIRTELGNRLVRIILRTGQPGQAPERKVITEYDINDYKHKAELSEQRLFTAITAAIRSYRDLRTIEQSRVGLQGAITASSALFAAVSLPEFFVLALEYILRTGRCAGVSCAEYALVAVAAEGGFDIREARGGRCWRRSSRPAFSTGTRSRTISSTPFSAAP